MKHRKTPRWVTNAIGQRPPRQSPLLSDLIGRLEVQCELCQRHGVYRADRLLNDLGDLALTEALQAIAERGGCLRAAKPPTVDDINFAVARCQIKRVVG